VVGWCGEGEDPGPDRCGGGGGVAACTERQRSFGGAVIRPMTALQQSCIRG